MFFDHFTTRLVRTKALILPAIAVASLSSTGPVHAVKKSAGCPTAPTQLLGAWKSEKLGSFEEFALSQEEGAPVFQSWLHHRPDIFNARWTYHACQLNIVTHDTALDTSFTVVSVTSKRLVLIERGEKYQQVYRRIVG